MASDDHSGEASAAGAGRSVAELFALGAAEHARGHYEAALEAYARLLDRDDAHPAALIHVADIYLHYGRPDEVRLIVRHMLGLDEAALLAGLEGLPAPTLHFIASCGEGEPERELADKLLARAVEVWPEAPEVHEAVAARLLEDGETESAESYYRHALELDPERIGTWNRLAELCLQADDEAGALEALLEVLERDPADRGAVRRIIGVINGLDDAELATRFLHRLVDLIEEDGEALTYIGFRLLAGERFDGALSAFARAADLDLESYEALIGAAAAAHGLGEPESVEAYWTQALVALPADAAAWLAMARTFAPDLPPALTRELVDGAAVLVSEQPERLCDVAETAGELGLDEAAWAVLGLALELDPVSLRARRLKAAFAGKPG